MSRKILWSSLLRSRSLIVCLIPSFKKKPRKCYVCSLSKANVYLMQCQVLHRFCNRSGASINSFISATAPGAASSINGLSFILRCTHNTCIQNIYFSYLHYHSHSNNYYFITIFTILQYLTVII